MEVKFTRKKTNPASREYCGGVQYITFTVFCNHQLQVPKELVTKELLNFLVTKETHTY